MAKNTRMKMHRAVMEQLAALAILIMKSSLLAVLWECLRVGHKYSLLAVAVGCYGNEVNRASFLFSDKALLRLLQNTNDPRDCSICFFSSFICSFVYSFSVFFLD